MGKQRKVFGLQRTSFFNGKRRIGIDTNVLIKLYDQPELFESEAARIFRVQDTVFVHNVSVRELARHIMNKKKCTEEAARGEAKQFIDAKGAKRFFCYIPKEKIRSFEQEANRKLQEMGKLGRKCHYPDSLILLGFKQMGINRVISTDEAMRICASFLGMDATRLPSLDAVIAREFRKMFDKKRRYWKRR